MGRAISGVNDLYTWCMNHGDWGMKLLSEWRGFDKDGNSLDIHCIAQQSNKYAVWECKFGHRWTTKIQKRTLLMSDCPYCMGSKPIAGENDLKTWCIKNNRQGLIEQFSGYDANGNPVSMSELLPKQSRKVKWEHCINGETHSWVAKVQDRTVHSSGCPICNGRNLTIKGKNDLETWCNNNPEFGSILKTQWVGLDDSGNTVRMSDIAYGSKRKLVWRCQCGNTWFASALYRTYNKSAVCPDCQIGIRESRRYKKVLESGGQLDQWCNNNGTFGKMISEQFAEMDDRGNKITMQELTPSQDRTVWWAHTTATGDVHEWLATVHNRTSNKQMCPYCSRGQTQTNEQVIYRILKKFFPDTLNRYKIDGFEYDVYIPSIKLCIEYDGEYYHTGREARDMMKGQRAAKLGLHFIRIVQSRNFKDVVYEDNCIKGNFDSNQKNTHRAIHWVLNKLGKDLSDAEIAKVYNQVLIDRSGN